MENSIKKQNLKVIKIYNNNIVAVINSHDKVSLVTGKGVGYHSRINQLLLIQEGWNIFELTNPRFDEYHNLLDNISIAAFEVSQKIYDLASSQLSYDINKLLVMVLADHISFKIELLKSNVYVPNLLATEIKLYYPNEFYIGKAAVDLINSTFGSELDDDEASYIAMHIINMHSESRENSVFIITEFIKTMIQLVKHDFSINAEDSSWVFERLIIHIKFLAQRLNEPQTHAESSLDVDLFSLSSRDLLKIKAFHQHADLIAHKLFGRTLSDNEQLYLSIHVLRIINQIGE